MIRPDINYVPTLGIRPCEMNALEYLPGVTKKNFKPCTLLAPWVNSKSLKNSITRFEKSYPKEPYFLDIDRVYSPKKITRRKQNEINSLLKYPDKYKEWINEVYYSENINTSIQKEMQNFLEPVDGYKKWIDFIKDYPNVHPCIQYQWQNTNQIQQQISTIKALGRPYCLRIDIQNIPKNINDIIAAFVSETDYTIILEGGWVRDPLTLMAKFSGLISNQLNTLKQNIPIVISCTSFPEGFTTISGIQPTPFENREMVEQLRNYSSNKIIYGDWGGARPRNNNSGGSGELIPARIDYPTKEAWYIARNKEAGWNYQMAAEKIMKDNNWHGNLGIWGEEMIERTAQKQSLGINTPRKNTASRINIHLHLQAFYGINDLDLTNIDLEDDFED